MKGMESKITLGTCYYPEHWDKSLWRDDLQRMLKSGIEVIRIAEFAWNKFEPEEGKYDFTFFDEFMDMAQEEGMKVIFCTPSATAPAWMTEKYPEVLNAYRNGDLLRHGNRQHTNLTSKIYLQFCRKISEELAKHYNKYSCIIGWQLDNEVNCGINTYYSESDHEAFRAYMKEKYQTLDNLNDKMGTNFWNQTYTDWNQVYLNRMTEEPMNDNPHMQLEEKRFISEMVYQYFKNQADVIRPYLTKNQFITTNGLFGHVDYHRLTEEVIDFITYDSYPNFAYECCKEKAKAGEVLDRNTNYNLMKTRAISDSFGIMEQQSGPGGWTGRMAQPSPKPGQMRLWTMQSIANGADYVSYFRWRTCGYGTEIYWHGLNNYDNRPNRRLEELEKIYQDVQKLAPVCGKKYQAAVAIIKDYDNEWDGEIDIWHGPMTESSTDGWFKAMLKEHIPVDFFYMRSSTKLEELMKYQWLMYPHATILTKDTTELLQQYVDQGGTLIMGCRTGYKDVYGRCPMMPMPGYASTLCGCTVEDFTFIGPQDEQEYFLWEGERASAPIFNDVLAPLEDGEILAVYEQNYYAGKPALIRRKSGNGAAYYFGGTFGEDTARLFIRKLSITKPSEALFDLPEGVEYAVRAAKSEEQEKYVFLLNYQATKQQITLKKEMYEIFSEQMINGTVQMEPYQVYCFR